jgi:transposase-like protein
MSRNKLRTYDKEFRLNAINLYLTSGRPYEQVSNELGIPVGTLVTWVQSHKKDGGEAFPGKGYLKPSDAEVMNLRKELAIVREERDILKKALGIFSSPRK